MPADRRQEVVLVARPFRSREVLDDATDQAERPQDGDRGEDRDDRRQPATASRRTDRRRE
jgi:hypothetical protein